MGRVFVREVSGYTRTHKEGALKTGLWKLYWHFRRIGKMSAALNTMKRIEKLKGNR